MAKSQYACFLFDAWLRAEKSISSGYRLPYAIAKEMKNVRVAFSIRDEDEIPKNMYQKIKCHMVFDVKMEDFRRNA